MKILLATDGSEESENAQQFVAALPLPQGSEIRVISVVSEPILPGGPYGEPPFANWEALAQIHDAEREYATHVLERASAALAREGVRVTTAHPNGHPPHQIIEAAEEFGADLVVLGATGLTGLSEFLIGSVAHSVARHCGRPVAVARAPRGQLRQVVLAVDGSEHSARAVEFAAGFPLPPECTIVVAHVTRPHHPRPAVLSVDPQGFIDAIFHVQRQRAETAEQMVAEAQSRLQAAGRQADTAAREGDPSDQILKLAAERGADVIIAGARGVSGVKGLVVGSVADRLVKNEPVTVILVH
jgi:nucleotide-binding universal stress UspA family protein